MNKLIALTLLLAFIVAVPASASVPDVPREMYRQTPGTSFTATCGPTTWLSFGSVVQNIPDNLYTFTFTAVGGGVITASAGAVTNSVSVPYDNTPRPYTLTVSRYTINEVVQIGFAADRTCTGGQLEVTNLLIQRDFVSARTKTNH